MRSVSYEQIGTGGGCSLEGFEDGYDEENCVHDINYILI